MARTATLGEAQVAIRATTEGLDKDLSGARSKIEKATDNMKTIGKVALGGILAAGAAITGLGIAAGGYVKEATLAAARSQEMGGVLEYLGQKAGWTSQQISDNVDIMRDLGIRTDVAQELLSQFARNQLDVADATMLASTAQDLAVLSGRDSSDTLAELSYAVQTQSSQLQVFRDLGIQAGDAMKVFADDLGITVEELDKTQRMQAMLNAVQERGVEIAGVYDTAMEAPGKRMRSLRRHFFETALSIGENFLPAFGSVIGIVENFIGTTRGLLEEGEPLQRLFSSIGDLMGSVFGTAGKGAESVIAGMADGLADLADKLVPIIDRVATFIEKIPLFIGLLDEGHPAVLAFKLAFGDIFPEETMDRLLEIVAGVEEFIIKVQEIVEPIMQWISENVKLQDVLIGLGVAIATVVLPVIWSIITAVAPVIATFLAAVAVVALLRTAWENDFLGIRTALTEAWNSHIKPALEKLGEWLGEKIPEAVKVVKDWWENQMLPALRTVWEFLSANVFPIFQTLAAFLVGAFKAAIETISSIWQNVLKPAIETVWGFLQDHVFPLFQAFGRFLSSVFSLVLTVMAGIWENVLAPALEVVFDWISDKLSPVFEALSDFWDTTLLPIIKKVSEWFEEKLGGALSFIGDLLDGLAGAFDKLGGWLEGLKDKLPDWMTPGSPTPLEIGLRGIGSALQQLTGMRLPAFRAGIELIEPEIGAVTSNLNDNRDPGEQTNVTYNLNANYEYQDEMTLTNEIRLLELLRAT